MNFWKVIEGNLWDEGFDVMNEDSAIQWESEKGLHRILLKNIAVDSNKLAWYQDEEYGRCWIKIRYSNELFLNWKPISNHSDYGFRFHFIKWYGNKLILIYGEKHREYIIKINDLNVDILYSGDISEIQIEDNVIYIEDFRQEIYSINLNLEFTEINNMSSDDFKLKFPNIQLKSYTYFFMNFDDDYNKNYR